MKDLSKIKLIISDFDQTLTTNHNQVDEITANKINQFIDLGYTFGIATGRSLPLFKDRIPELKLGHHIIPLITYQGAVIANSLGMIEYEKVIPRDIVIKVVKHLEEKKLYFHLSTATDLYVIDYMKDLLFFNRVERFAEIANYSESLYNFVMDNPNLNILQISILSEPEDTDKVRDSLNDLFKDEVLFVKSHPQIIETTEITTSKANAVKQLQKSMNLKNDEIMIIGDSLNDLSMFETGFVKVAVANAEPILKEKADYISSSSSDLGVAKIIDKIILAKEQSLDN